MLAMKYIEIKKYTYKITSTILFLYENNFKYIKILNVTDNVNRENFNKKYVDKSHFLIYNDYQIKQIIVNKKINC